MRKTKEEKRIEKLVETAFYKHGTGIQFNIMSLSKLSAHAAAAAKMPLPAGKTLEEAIEAKMIEAIAIYREPETMTA